MGRVVWAGYHGVGEWLCVPPKKVLGISGSELCKVNEVKNPVYWAKAKGMFLVMLTGGLFDQFFF